MKQTNSLILAARAFACSLACVSSFGTFAANLDGCWKINKIEFIKKNGATERPQMDCTIGYRGDRRVSSCDRNLILVYSLSDVAAEGHSTTLIARYMNGKKELLGESFPTKNSYRRNGDRVAMTIYPGRPSGNNPTIQVEQELLAVPPDGCSTLSKYFSTGGASENSDREEATGGDNIADEFYKDSTAAIRHYSVSRNISFKVADIVTRQGNVYLMDRQVPKAVIRQSEKMAGKPFSWDNFHKQSQQGVGNPYANIYTIVCAVSLDEFSRMPDVAKGKEIRLKAKLNSYAGQEITFDCNQ